MNEKSSKIFENLFFIFSISVAVVTSIMIGNLVSTLENWAYRNWVSLSIFILMILLGLILIILVPLGLYSYFSKKLGIKIKNFENIHFALIITVLLTSFFRDDILKVTSMAGSSPQDFLTFVGSYLGLFVLIGIYYRVFRWALSSIKKPKLKMTRKSNLLKITMEIKEIFRKRWPQVKESLRVAAWLAAIITAIFVIITTYEVKESILKTEPDLIVVGVYPFLVGPGGGYSEIEKDRCALHYHDENEIDYFHVEVKIANIGSGVAYDLDVKLSLPGLIYSEIEREEDGARKYVGDKLIEEVYSWRDNFRFRSIILSPLGGDEIIELKVPFEAIGSIENLPSLCMITVTDITEKVLLNKVVTFQYIQH